MSEKRASGVDNTSRRNWNKSDYEQKAKEREIKVHGVLRSCLDSRDGRWLFGGYGGRLALDMCGASCVLAAHV